MQVQTLRTAPAPSANTRVDDIDTELIRNRTHRTLRGYRFNRYEIAGGYIRPAPGAVLEEYAPWEAHRSWINRAGETAPP